MWGAKLVVHGDDFTFLGDDSMLDFCERMMAAHFEIKIRGRLGPEKHDAKIIRILNNCIPWTGTCIMYECDPRHADIIVKK